MRRGLVIDVETVPESLKFGEPVELPEEFSPPYEPPARRSLPRNYKAGSEAAERWEAAETARLDYAIAEGRYKHEDECLKNYLRLALNPRRCRVVAWAIAPMHREEGICAAGEDERDLLERLDAELRRHQKESRQQPVLLAWNGPGFDYRVLFSRMRVNGLWGRKRFQPAARQGRVYWATESQYDLMAFAPGATSGRLSKAKAAANWGLTIDTPSGAMVPALWAKGDLATIQEHCAEDVRIELALAEKYEVADILGVEW